MATAVVWVGDRAVVWVATEVFVGDPAGFGTAVVTSVLEVTQTAVASVVLTFTQTHIHIHTHTHSYHGGLATRVVGYLGFGDRGGWFHSSHIARVRSSSISQGKS